MRRHWQRRPLMVRGAWPGVASPADRAQLFNLAGQESVESRCVEQTAKGWRLRHGPFSRRALPPVSRPGWTLLVQGLDHHLEAAHAMLRRFGFIPQARLDDLMLSYASDGGGVGPHVDSYDVFLLQVQGRRRWRIAPPGKDRLVPGLPLRILAEFEAQREWVLEPGDMLYLPPGWGHEGVALGGDCMTASIGFRSPTAGELTLALLERAADEWGEELQEANDSPGAPGDGPSDGLMDGPSDGLSDELSDGPRDGPGGASAGRSLRGPARARLRERRRHTDAGLEATVHGGRIPTSLARFAQIELERLLQDSGRWQRALGCWLTEPKPTVCFEDAPADEPGRDGSPHGALRLDRRSRVAYDDHHFFINGEAFRVGGRDAGLLRELADRRRLAAKSRRRLSAQAAEILEDWIDRGWLHSTPDGA